MQLKGDIKFYHTGFTEFGDIKVSGSDLVNDAGLETSVIISLFSDRRADPEDVLPNPTDFRRGWWADSLTGSSIGSKLWLLERTNINDRNLMLAEQYVKDALAWMVLDQVADRIDCKVYKSKINTVTFETLIYKKNENSIYFKWFLNWESQIAWSE